MVNLLSNPSFEEGWSHPGGVPELQVPNDWAFWFSESDPNPHSSDPWNKFVRPEMRVLPRAQLPESERDLFILDGDHTLKIFKGHGAWFGGLRQRIYFEPGVYELRVQAYADLVKEYRDGRKIWADDPQKRDGLIRFRFNGHSYEWISLVPGEWNTPSLTFAAEDEIEIGVDFMLPFALANSGVFCDAWKLVRVSDGEPGDGRGEPREQYERTYYVLPPHATKEQACAVLCNTFDQRRTVGFSYDDAGIGDLDVRYAVLLGILDGERPIFTEWYKEHYPGVKVTFEPLPGDGGNGNGNGGTSPKPYTYLTFHLQRPVTNWLKAVKRLADVGRPLRYFKIVHEGMELARDIKAVSPDTFIVFRHVDDDRSKYVTISERGGFKVAAKTFLDRFLEGIRRNPIQAVESLNEMYATNDEAGCRWAAQFDAAFCEVLAQETNGDVRPVVLTAPPGNPDHNEVDWLLPAARAAKIHDGIIGGHNYFAAVPQTGVPERWMIEEALHYSMRPLLSWDPVFKREGIELPYAMGESGAVAVHVRPDGRPGGFIGSEIGWRSSGCLRGDLVRYIKLWLIHLQQIEDWNKENDYRCWGPAIFTTGGGDQWRYFEFDGGNWNALVDALLADVSSLSRVRWAGRQTVSNTAMRVRSLTGSG